MDLPALCVYWTSYADCLAIGHDAPAAWPEYVRREWRSRTGRNGRGRLWIPGGLSPLPPAVFWDVTSPLADAAETAGGIVLRREDAPAVAGWPGFLTDMNLAPLNLREVLHGPAPGPAGPARPPAGRPEETPAPAPGPVPGPPARPGPAADPAPEVARPGEGRP